MFGATVLIISLAGRRIERGLEIVSFLIAGWIIVYLLITGILFIPGKAWKDVAVGFFRFGYIPTKNPNFSWILLANLAAYAAAGGVSNCIASNWVRDKGWGMGGVVGYIPSLIEDREVRLSPVGKIFRVTTENLNKWKGWWKFVNVDQWGLYGFGCLLGMYLCVVLAVGAIPQGTKVTGLAVGAYQAEYLGRTAGRAWYFLTLFNGFWIMFGTQLVVVDVFTRFATDAIWMGSPRARRWSKDNPRRIYYLILAIFVIWGCLGLSVIPKPFKLLQIGATAAAFWFTVVAVHVIYVNRKFLPKELKCSRLKEAMVWGCAIFYGIFGVFVVLDRLGIM